MCNLQKCLIAAVCLSGTVLLSGCVATDTYYSSTSYGVVPAYPVYVGDDVVVGGYYQSQSTVITNWPYYGRPFIQREYYYTWY